jgi:predicted oxidoreductase
MISKKVIVRGIQSGVYFGTLKKNSKDNVVLENVRNLWYYKGANNLSDVATKGISRTDSKISCVVSEMEFKDIIQIIPCSQKSIESIENADIWTY